MNLYWRKEPLGENEEMLLKFMIDAHFKSAFRDSASSAAVGNAAVSSGDMVKAIAAGLMTLGERHAPVEQTFRFLSFERPDREVASILKAERMVPGWGGTFQKNEHDPIWDDTAIALYGVRPDLTQKLEEVTLELHRNGKHIHPNPSAYTAATAMALGLEAKTAVYLFIAARIDAWARIAAKYLE